MTALGVRSEADMRHSKCRGILLTPATQYVTVCYGIR